MKKKYEVAIGAVIAGGLLLSATPAFAEGTWSSYLTKVGVGFSSRSWIDNQNDQVATTVSLSGCTIASGATFLSATLNMYREFGIFADQSVGSIVNKCNTTDWGQALPGDSYHFTIDALNLNTSLSPRMSAKSVVTVY